MKALIKFVVYLAMVVIAIYGITILGWVQASVITVETAISSFAIVVFTFLVLTMIQGIINMIEEGDDKNG